MAIAPPPDRQKRTPRIDLSKLTPRQVDVRAAVVALGEAAYGPRWKAPLAAALAEATGREIAQPQVSHWLSGERAVPEALLPALTNLAAAAVANLEERAAAIRTAWPMAEGDTP